MQCGEMYNLSLLTPSSSRSRLPGRHNIHDPIVLVPHRVGENALGAYWRKGAGVGPAKATGISTHTKNWPSCVGQAAGQLRARGSFNPDTLVPMPPQGPPGVSLGNHGLKGRKDLYMCV